MLDVDAKPVGDAVDERVVARDLGDGENVCVAETSGSQHLDVGADQRGRGARQLLDVGQHRQAPIVQSCRPIILFDSFQQRVVVQQAAQTAPMVRDSIMAPVEPAHDERDHLALELWQAGGSRHRRAVQRHMGS